MPCPRKTHVADQSEPVIRSRSSESTRASPHAHSAPKQNHGDALQRHQPDEPPLRWRDMRLPHPHSKHTQSVHRKKGVVFEKKRNCSSTPKDPRIYERTGRSRRTTREPKRPSKSTGIVKEHAEEHMKKYGQPANPLRHRKRYSKSENL